MAEPADKRERNLRFRGARASRARRSNVPSRASFTQIVRRDAEQSDRDGRAPRTCRNGHEPTLREKRRRPPQFTREDIRSPKRRRDFLRLPTTRSVLECASPSTSAARHSAAPARRRLALWNRVPRNSGLDDGIPLGLTSKFFFAPYLDNTEFPVFSSIKNKRSAFQHLRVIGKPRQEDVAFR